MTHREFIRNTYKVIAETKNAIFFEAYGERIAEINGEPFHCKDLQEFHELCEFWDDEEFAV